MKLACCWTMGESKNSYLIADNRRKISAFSICRINIPYILHTSMLKYWPLRSGIDIWWIKLKSPNHVRYRLSVGLRCVEVISASQRSVWTSGAKNMSVYFKLTRSCGDCWSSCPILLLINKIKIVSDIGWSSAISAWDCHLIHDNGIGLLSTAAMKCLHLSLFCQKRLFENFWTNFPSTFCNRTSFQSAFFTEDQFSLGPVFLTPWTHSEPLHRSNLGELYFTRYFRALVGRCLLNRIGDARGCLT